MEVRDRILFEATRLFRTMGIKSVRMDDIAVACGISKRTLYEIFSDREDLISNSLQYQSMIMEREFLKKTADAENVIDEFWILIIHASENGTVHKKMFMDLLKFYPKIFEDFMKNYYGRIVENNRLRLERGIEQGLFLKNLETEFLAATLTTYLYGLHKDLEELSISTHVMNTNSTPSSLQFAIMLYFRGIGTEKGIKYIDEKILKIK